MEYKVKLEPPLMPNFISIETPPTQKGEKFQESYKIRVCDLSNDEAKEYGELMKQAFIQHHKEHIERECIKKNICICKGETGCYKYGENDNTKCSTCGKEKNTH